MVVIALLQRGQSLYVIIQPSAIMYLYSSVMAMQDKMDLYTMGKRRARPKLSLKLFSSGYTAFNHIKKHSFLFLN
jgi:hypothetical protein